MAGVGHMWQLILARQCITNLISQMEVRPLVTGDAIFWSRTETKNWKMKIKSSSLPIRSETDRKWSGKFNLFDNLICYGKKLFLVIVHYLNDSYYLYFIEKNEFLSFLIFYKPYENTKCFCIFEILNVYANHIALKVGILLRNTLCLITICLNDI